MEDDVRSSGVQVRSSGQEVRSGVRRPSESMQNNVEANFTAGGQQIKTLPGGQDEALASYLEMTD